MLDHEGQRQRGRKGGEREKGARKKGRREIGKEGGRDGGIEDSICQSLPSGTWMEFDTKVGLEWGRLHPVSHGNGKL